MAVEQNILGFEAGNYYEISWGSGVTASSSAVTEIIADGTARSGTYHLRKTTNSGGYDYTTLHAGPVVGTSGTVTTGNHKRVRMRCYFRFTSTSHANGHSPLIGFGTNNGTCTVQFGQDNIGGFAQYGNRIGLRITSQNPTGGFPWSTVDLLPMVWYRLILDVDLNVGATTVVTASVRITEDAETPTIDFTLSNSMDIGATDALHQLVFGRVAPDTMGMTFHYDDVVYNAASNADAINPLTLPEGTRVLAFVPTGVAIAEWETGTYTNVTEIPFNPAGPMMSSVLGTGTEVAFMHASAATLGVIGVSALKLHVNAVIAGAGTGLVDAMLNGVSKSLTLLTNWASTGAVDPIGGVAWGFMYPSEFNAMTFGLVKQNGTQQTYLGNIFIEYLALSSAELPGTMIRGSTQIKPRTITGDRIGLAELSNEHVAPAAGLALTKLEKSVVAADGSVPFTADQSMGTNKLTNVVNPAGAQDAATKSYVDTTAQPLNVKLTAVSVLANAEGVLTNDGAGVFTWGAGGGGSGGGGGGGGATVLIASLTAAASASLNFTLRNVDGQSGALFQGDFDEYVIEIVGLLPVTNSVGVQLRFSTDGGATWALGASDYQWSFMAYGSGGPGNTASTAATSISLNGFANYTNTTLRPVNGAFRLYAPGSTAAYKMISGHVVYWDATPTLVASELVGAYQSTSAINALQLFASSGDLASGTVRVYGVVKTAVAGSGGGGALILLQSQTAAANAQLDFTSFSASYDEYVFEFVNVLPATTADLWMRCSTNGGASFDATANNYHHSYRYTSSASNTVNGSSSEVDTKLMLCGSTVSATAAAGGVRGTLKLFDPLSATIHKTAVWNTSCLIHANQDRYYFDGAGWYVVTTAVNAVRFMFSTGNIASGTIRMYGVAKVGVSLRPEKVVQVVNYQTGAAATGSTVIPLDDTIPQNTEGDEYMTVTITPTSATNKLRIDVVAHLAHSVVNTWLTAAIFQDNDADALVASVETSPSADGNTVLAFTHYMIAGLTSATTFRVRCGGNGAGTLTFNGRLGVRRYGGVMASSITITEITPDYPLTEVTAVQTTTQTGTVNDFTLALRCSQLRCNNATLLTLTGLTAGIPGQRITIVAVGAGQVDITNQGAGSVAGNRVINGVTGTISLVAGLGRAVLEYDGTTARWRVISHTQGGWITPAYSASNFNASGSLIWTVEAGDVITYKYWLRGKTMVVTFSLDTTTLSGTVSSQLWVKVPGGHVIAAFSLQPQFYLNVSGGYIYGFSRQTVGGTNLELFKADYGATNYTLGTNDTYVYSTVTFEVQ